MLLAFFSFCLHVCFVLFWFVYLLLFIFICFLKKEAKRRHEDGGVRSAGSGRTQGRENHDGKILHKKIKRKKNITWGKTEEDIQIPALTNIQN